ncbi:MAG: 3-deoxy-7-phosphoheptulonate synthase [Deltaproteobacteria bacterium]|nr:MAG: 3-deoxy-7-phosphoheptulonate synthase [Deltaproteobacteria bacterium]
MRQKIENLNLLEVTPLVPPRAVKSKLPLNEAVAELVLRTRGEIRDVLHGRDAERLVVVVGPCSIHDPEAARDYARRLRRVIDATRDELVVLMRTYFEKPRTTVGWKGLINDPRLDGSCDIAAGIELARATLLEINALGVPCASEALDPVTPDYIADLLSWASIGARTAESQTHRQMASGLSMPIGFKNGTDGSVDAAKNAMISSGHPHSFLGVSPDGAAAVIKTTGNPDRHIVLRGGGGRPNYRHDDVERAARLVADEGIARPIMVDCSHANSGRDPARQGEVCRDVLAQVRAGERAIMGLMLESNLAPGKQTWKPDVELEYGVSITDACIGWEETEALLGEIARTVAAKRAT